MTHKKKRVVHALSRKVEVEWVDSSLCHGWQSVKNKREDQGIEVCKSVGYLLSSDKTQVCIVMSVGGVNSVCDGLSIPRAAVKAVKKLR